MVYSNLLAGDAGGGQEHGQVVECVRVHALPEVGGDLVAALVNVGALLLHRLEALLQRHVGVLAAPGLHEEAEPALTIPPPPSPPPPPQLRARLLPGPVLAAPPLGQPRRVGSALARGSAARRARGTPLALLRSARARGGGELLGEEEEGPEEGVPPPPDREDSAGLRDRERGVRREWYFSWAVGSFVRVFWPNNLMGHPFSGRLGGLGLGLGFLAADCWISKNSVRVSEKLLSPVSGP